MAILALTKCAFCAMLNPRRSCKTNHIGFIYTCLCDVIAYYVSLTWVVNASWTAFTFRNHTKFAVNFWARQRPAINFTLQTSALLTVLYPGFSTFIGNISILMQALTAEPWITFRTAKQVNRWIFAVTNHATTHYQSNLA